MKTQAIDIDLLRPNRGEIDGLPANPRFIKDQRFKKLCQSVEDNPEFLEYRPCLIVPYKSFYIVIAGNMRFKACEHLQMKTVPCIVLDKNTPVEKLRAYTIKDNIAFGADDWDMLANEWDEDDLEKWGVEKDFEKEKGKTRVTIQSEHTCPNCGHVW